MRTFLIIAFLSAQSAPAYAQLTTWLEQDFDVPGAGASFEVSDADVTLGSLNLSPAGTTGISMATFSGLAIPACAYAWILDFDFFLAPGPDGLGVIFSNENASGPPNATHPYARVFMDTYQNPWDPNGNHVELRWGLDGDPMWNTDTENVPYGTPSFDMDGAQWHHATISYLASEMTVVLTPGGGTPEVVLSSVEVPILAGAEWWLRFLDFNSTETRVDNVVVQTTCETFIRGNCNGVGFDDLADVVFS